MRVLIDCRMAEWTGIGRYTTSLVRALAARDDIELVQFVDRGQIPPITAEDPDGLSAEMVVQGGHPFTPIGGWAFSTAVNNAEPDVVHAVHFPTPIPAKHPLVVTLHDLIPMIQPEVMPSPVDRAVYGWWNRRAARIADVIVANSEHTASDVQRMLPDARGKTVVTLLAAERGVSEGPIDELPAQMGGGPYVLSMGNTKPNKGLPALLAAFALVAPAHPDLRLWLVGADQQGYVASILGDDPAAARVGFTGRLDDDQLRAAYGHARAFAFPSRYEGFGLPPLEAMAYGTPVVVADAASLPEVVGDAGLLVPPDDAEALAHAVERLLTDDALRESLVTAGRERAATFTWERTAAGTVAAYERAIEVAGGC